MDSLKNPKSASGSGGNSGAVNTGSSSSSKPSGVSGAITVRFNAGEESIDDIFQSFHSSGAGGGSGGMGTASGTNLATSGPGAGGGGGGGGGGDSALSSSPSQHHQSQQNMDEVNTRNNFLQSNFFTRKRSGSIEGISPTSMGPNLMAALSSSEASSVGTWKLIKGKVSQTIEDMKSSKGAGTQVQTTSTVPVKGEELQPHALPQTFPVHDPEQEKSKATAALKEELPPEGERHSTTGGVKKPPESDTDFESEIILEADVEQSRLRRGIANLKSRVKGKQFTASVSAPASASTLAPTSALSSTVRASKKDTSPSRSIGSSSSTTSLRETFLRKRRKASVETGELASPTSTMASSDTPTGGGVTASSLITLKHSKPSSSNVALGARREVEIESGVEMLEDMIPHTAPVGTKDGQSCSANDNGDEADKSTDRKRREMELPLHGEGIHLESAHVLSDNSASNTNNRDLSQTESSQTMRSAISDAGSFQSLMSFSSNLVTSVKYLPSFSLLGLVMVLWLPIHDFIRGILACLLTMTILESTWTFVQSLIERILLSHPSEKKTFAIPNYDKMSICEIPAAKEHKTVKTYAGWMNEVDRYDPDNFHISMAKSVYVKLDGTILQVSNTTARIPKRVMWNELPIDRKILTFTTHRTYNLLGCRVELLPLGLARKRHFNRKYPIQLIVKRDSFDKADVESLRRIAKRSHKVGGKKSKPDAAESQDDLTQRVEGDVNVEVEEMDFGATILKANLQDLQDNTNPDEELRGITVPCGDEVRLLLFARGAREKEDWYRRFKAASVGEVSDQGLHLENIKLIDDKDLQAAAAKVVQLLTTPSKKDLTNTNQAPTTSSTNEDSTSNLPPNKEDNAEEEDDIEFLPAPDEAETIEGMLMSSCVARNDPDYIRFMSLYQKACNQSKIPVYRGKAFRHPQERRSGRRNLRHENELWKGVDQSLFLGPSGSVVWANVLIGRVLYSCLHNDSLLEKIKDIFQKKINSVKLPGFMENVIIKDIDLGNNPPLIHRVSQPILDERGVWVDADITYEGLCHITVTTKLNLLRLRRPVRANLLTETNPSLGRGSSDPHMAFTLKDELADSVTLNRGIDEDIPFDTRSSSSAIYDSDAESSGDSSSESDSFVAGATGENVTESSSPGNARRIFKFVDRIATSNFFQYATELSYVQRAMENMNANITLGVDLKGLVSRVTINIPPPPSDRIWLAFRAPPRLWITAKPTVGDKSVDWGIVTNVIEGKLCEAVNKYLVYPNMVDLTLPFLSMPASEQ